MKKTLLIGAVSLFCAAVGPVSAVTHELERIWEKHSEDYTEFFVTENRERGMAYNPTTDHLLIASTSNNVVHIIGAEDGEYVGQLDMSGVGGGTFVINKVQISEDGAIYVGNLSTDTSGASTFNLYRWEDEWSLPVRVFKGDPSGGTAGETRWGDSMALRGTGADTMILLGSYNGQMLAVLRPNPDGLMSEDSFSAQQIMTDVKPTAARNVAFGPGSLVYLTSRVESLFELEIDFETGTVLGQREFGGGIIARGMGPLGYGAENEILVGLRPSTHDVFLYSRLHLTVEWTVNPLATFKFAPTQPDDGYLDNGNGTGEVIVVGDIIYVLDTNNSIAALRYVVTESPFELWIATQDVPAGQRRAGDDPDGDGFSNLLEYALGGDPAVASRDIAPLIGIESAGDDRYLSIAYSKRATAEGINFIVEVSPDLVNWEDSTTVVSENAESAIVRDTIPMTDSNRRFIRLRVEDQ